MKLLKGIAVGVVAILAFGSVASAEVVCEPYKGCYEVYPQPQYYPGADALIYGLMGAGIGYAIGNNNNHNNHNNNYYYYNGNGWHGNGWNNHGGWHDYGHRNDNWHGGGDGHGDWHGGGDGGHHKKRWHN